MYRQDFLRMLCNEANKNWIGSDGVSETVATAIGHGRINLPVTNPLHTFTISSVLGRSAIKPLGSR